MKEKTSNKILMIILMSTIMLIAMGMLSITKADTISFSTTENAEGEGFSWDCSTKILTITNMQQPSSELSFPKNSTINIQGQNENKIKDIYAIGDLTIKGNQEASLTVCGYDLKTSITTSGPYEIRTTYAQSVVLNGGVLTIESGNFNIDAGCNWPITGIYASGITVNDGNVNINVRGEINKANAVNAVSKDIIINGGTITACTSKLGKAFNKEPVINYECKIYYSEEESLDNAQVTTDKDMILSKYASVKIEAENADDSNNSDNTGDNNQESNDNQENDNKGENNNPKDQGTQEKPTTPQNPSNSEEQSNPVVSKQFPFTDVKQSDWYYNSVKFVYDRDIILGTTATTFKPNNNLTRGMLVTILWRMEGSPLNNGGKEFPDVKSSEYYYTAVKWAESKKIVSGYENGKFGPNNYITREQLSVMMYNYAKYKGKIGKETIDIARYVDYKTVSGYAEESVKWAIANKVISGKENGTKIAPRGNATRAETAAVIQNYLVYVK